MSLSRFKEQFFRLSREQKLIGVGSLIVVLSTLMPWYADLDAYNIGDEFLGITGPTSFLGFTILLLSGLSFSVILFKILGRRSPRILPAQPAKMHLFNVLQSFFCLIVINSVYFHPKFGFNVPYKETRFGMILAFFGIACMFVGSYMSYKAEVRGAGDDEGRLEPLIKIDRFDSMDAGVRSHAPIARSMPEEDSPMKEETIPTQVSEASPRQQGGGGSYKIRMDL